MGKNIYIALPAYLQCQRIIISHYAPCLSNFKILEMIELEIQLCETKRKHSSFIF